MRLRGDIDLQDERYRGQHTTRRAAFGSGADDTGSDGTGGDESDAGASEPDSLVRSAGALDGLSGATPSSSEEGDDGLDGSRDQVGEQLGAGSGAVLANGNGLHVSSDEDASQESGGDGRDAGDGSYDAGALRHKQQLQPHLLLCVQACALPARRETLVEVGCTASAVTPVSAQAALPGHC